MKQYQETSHKKLFIASVISVAFLVMANLIITNILATTGEQLRNLESRRTTLAEQNRRLRQKIINESTLSKVEKKAQLLGFSAVSKTVNLTPGQSVALNQP